MKKYKQESQDHLQIQKERNKLQEEAIRQKEIELRLKEKELELQKLQLEMMEPLSLNAYVQMWHRVTGAWDRIDQLNQSNNCNGGSKE